MNDVSFALFKHEYKAGNKENWIFHLSDTIAAEIDIIENSNYVDVDFNPLIDVFDKAANVFLANKDAKNALGLYQHLYSAFLSWHEKATGTKIYTDYPDRCNVPARVMIALYDIVRMYMDLNNVDMSQHVTLIVGFIRSFREYIKAGRQPENVHKILVEYSKAFPEDLGSISSQGIRWYLQHKLSSTPIELASFLMPLLSEENKTIPDGVALVPYKNEATQKWGFKDKLTGHVLVPAQFTAIGTEKDWVDGLVWVKKGYDYYKFGRDQQLIGRGVELTKIDGLGYFHSYFSKEYYDMDWNIKTTKQEIAYRYGELMKSSAFNWSTICTKDQEMAPIADVSNCAIVKYLKKYSPSAILSALFATFFYIFIIQVMFLSDASVIKTWEHISDFANFLYILFIPVFVIGFPLLCMFIHIEVFPFFHTEGEISHEIFSDESLVISLISCMVEFWSLMGIIPLIGRSGFWPVTGLVVCSVIGAIALIVSLHPFSYIPKIKGMKRGIGTNLFWIITSQLVIAANLAIAHFVFCGA